MSDTPLENISATDAYKRARSNALRRYPAPERDGDRLYPLAGPQAKASFKMAPTDKVFTIGSCFARNVEAALRDVGVEIVSDVPDLGPVGEALGFAANLFNKYSIHSVCNDLKWALERDSYPADDVIYEMPGGGYCDLQLGIPKLDFPIADIHAFRSKYLDVFARVADADVIILTLGYVETWFDTELGIYLNIAPPPALVKAHPDRFEFRVLSYQDVLDGLRTLYALLGKHRQKPLRMLVTVSPVPLLSTFRDMDVLVANTYSKSVQRAAIDEFVRATEGVDYFPSYEYVILSNPSVAWSRGDFRHVSPDLVARIMSNVIKTYLDAPDTADDANETEMTLPALQSSARMLLKAGEYEALLDLARTHPDMVATDHTLRVMLGNASVKTGAVDEAFAHFEAAFALNSRQPAILERLITLCRPTRQPERELELLDEHEQRFPGRKNFRKQIRSAPRPRALPRSRTDTGPKPRAAQTDEGSSATEPDLSVPIADRIDRLENALVVPPPRGDQNRSVQKSGVLDARGRFVETSITWRNGNQANLAPDIPADAEIEHLPGTYMFAGLLFGHFGHFLVESIARLWALDTLKSQIDGLVFVPKFQNNPQHVLRTYQPLLRDLGVDLPVLNLEMPTRIENLFVPLQGFGMFDLIEGAPEFRDFVNTHAGRGIDADGPEKIYISRTALPAERGGILGETRLEALLEAEGYVAFHPQNHDFRTQIATYKAARQIISADASPLHLVAMVGDADQRIACIARRNGHLETYFERQIRAFKGSHVTPIDVLERNWIPETDARPSRVSVGELDFAALHAALLADGFIDSDTPWAKITDAERQTLVAELSAHRNMPFKCYEADVAA